MPETLTIDESRMRMKINGSLRGDQEIEAPVLVSIEATVTILDRSYFSDLVSGFGFVERKGPFPESYKEIDDKASDLPGKAFEIYELVNDALVGLSAERLKKSIRWCAGDGQFDSGRFKLYHPSGSTGHKVAPFMLVTDHTPATFVVHRLYESKSEFVENFGAGACPDCQKKFASNFVKCPDCSEIPESVQHNIELSQEEHDGVIILIAPVIDFSDYIVNEIRAGEIPVRRPLEHADPNIDVIKSPGLQNRT